MNRENIATLIQDVRTSRTFTMAYEVDPTCGSPGCLIGHAALRQMGVESFVWDDNGRPRWDAKETFSMISGLHKKACRYLDLTISQTYVIFSPEPQTTHYNWMACSGRFHITQEHAICMLEAIYNDAPIDENIWLDTDPETSRGQKANAERMESQLVPA